MDNNIAKRQKLANRFVAVATAHGASQYEEKNLQMAAQIGYLAGLLGRYASHYGSIRLELAELEQQWQIDTEHQ
jgi:hypothetical protein